MVAVELKRERTPPAPAQGEFNPAKEWFAHLIGLDPLGALAELVQFLQKQPEKNDEMTLTTPPSDQMSTFDEYVKQLP